MTVSSYSEEVLKFVLSTSLHECMKHKGEVLELIGGSHDGGLYEVVTWDEDPPTLYMRPYCGK